ncbi:TetR/AcrR family transcriptional regulator [Actinophytocola algeriensis]|jgi:AcrR family transcriptional regulator|uniref:AcrR family transcriptional regulator n=1 Tax=Actinophytocola algeriensis TaxID=1768010 RepID=A0A7W7QEW1_9PSEU|nr:TetR/AcrR family transcriptional regulator [Actinophytocola algeriensis]MBB4912347.1 AcrR family transcriptional regulator [Actinophytocola algeriensis]MBE1481080.1 AcrR family transcriptional regulator [Actinophytocola algeriensis]
MARPRKVSDEELIAACGRAIGRFGPGFTLAQVAGEAGVAVGTVAGRFGSKQNMLLTMMTMGAEGAAPMMRAAAAGRAPLDAITTTILATTEAVADPATTSNHLGQLGVDLADPALRAGFARLRAGVREVLTDLFTAADLPGAPPPAQAARIIAAMAHGALMDWALDPVGEFADVLRADLDAVLAAWSVSLPG